MLWRCNGGYVLETGILQQACKWGHWELVVEQLKLLRQCNEENEEKKIWEIQTALYEACCNKYFKLADKIISYDAKWDSHFWTERTFSDKILLQACTENWSDVAGFILSRGDPNVNRGLYRACYRGSYDVAELLLKYGAADVDRALSNACENRHRECAKLMIENGARNFDIAIKYAHNDIVEWLYKQKRKYKPHKMKKVLSKYFCSDIVNLILRYAWSKDIETSVIYEGWNSSCHSKKSSILKQACESGHWELVMKQLEILKKNESLIEQRRAIQLAFCAACDKKYFNLAEEILSHNIILKNRRKKDWCELADVKDDLKKNDCSFRRRYGDNLIWECAHFKH